MSDTEGLQPLSAIVRWIGRSGKRIAVTVAGFAMLIAGGVMMVTPGPGVLIIVLGLALLATEWAWAERALDKAKQSGKVVLDQATASPIRIVLSVLLTLGGIAAGIWAFLYFT
ncbi:MAG TPA: PGPGW domain-containing protein [Actinomycetota bacterium]|nr:PGPGW domain-containing protein [Actinomycetota bacterium]